MAELLLLFDVDGTLLQTQDAVLSQAMARALAELTGEEVPDDAMLQVEHTGRTARAIARMILRRFGIGAVPDLREWCRLTEERYAELLAAADTSDWRPPDGAETALERLASQHRLALVTGNPERVARVRVERIGLARFFPEGQGAFGCESEDRVDLVDRARARASDWPADQTILIGNLPFAEMTARAAGVRSIRVADDGDVRSFAQLAADLVVEAEPDAPRVDDMAAGDWHAVAGILAEGLEGGWETDVPSWETWNGAHLETPRLVARLGDRVVGYAALSPYSQREAYAGVVDDAVYVTTDMRGQGVGRLLLTELVRRAEEAGLWTVQASCFAENRAAIALHESCGFRVVGTRDRIGKKDGVWRDVVVLERRSPQID